MVALKDIVAKTSKKTEVAKDQCDMVLRAALEAIEEYLVAGEKVSIRRMFYLEPKVGKIACGLVDGKEVDMARVSCKLYSGLRGKMIEASKG